MFKLNVFFTFCLDNIEQSLLITCIVDTGGNLPPASLTPVEKLPQCSEGVSAIEKNLRRDVTTDFIDTSGLP
jgi:hypothetical protein